MEYAGVVHGERESLTDQDPHSLLFGHDEDEFVEHPAGPYQSRASRHQAERSRRRRLRRRRRAFGAMTAIVLVVVLAVGYVAYRGYQNRYHPKDYAGQGTGQVLVTVRSGEGAGDIAKTLADKGVVRTTRAFTKAAADNSASANISPGTYRLHTHMSAKSALTMLLDDSSRVSSNVVVF
jgi:UPF0755 protein